MIGVARIREAGPAAIVAAGLGLALVTWIGALRLGWYADDVITDLPVYREAADAMLAGDLPYRDFTLEYPPLAAVAFWLAALLPGSYAAGFSALMLGCLCATVLAAVILGQLLQLGRGRALAAALATGATPLMLGALVETRYDLLLSAVLAWTLVAAVADRLRIAWTLLGIGVLVKLAPLILAPVLAVYTVRRLGPRAAAVAAGYGAGVVAAVALPLAIVAPSGAWEVVGYHLERPLQIESTGAAYLLALHALADIPLEVTSSFGSQGLPGAEGRVIAAVSSLLLIGLVAAIAVTFWRLLRDADRLAGARLLVAASAATIAVGLAAAKVFSPQFLVWLIPVGFLVAGRFGLASLGLSVAAMLMTLAYFPGRYWDLVGLESLPIWLLIVRDGLVLCLVAAAWPRPARATAPRPAGALSRPAPG